MKILELSCDHSKTIKSSWFRGVGNSTTPSYQDRQRDPEQQKDLGYLFSRLAGYLVKRKDFNRDTKMTHCGVTKIWDFVKNRVLCLAGLTRRNTQYSYHVKYDKPPGAKKNAVPSLILSKKVKQNIYMCAHEKKSTSFSERMYSSSVTREHSLTKKSTLFFFRTGVYVLFVFLT